MSSNFIADYLTFEFIQKYPTLARDIAIGGLFIGGITFLVANSQRVQNAFEKKNTSYKGLEEFMSHGLSKWMTQSDKLSSTFRVPGTKGNMYDTNYFESSHPDDITRFYGTKIVTENYVPSKDELNVGINTQTRGNGKNNNFNYINVDV